MSESLEVRTDGQEATERKGRVGPLGRVLGSSKDSPLQKVTGGLRAQDVKRLDSDGGKGGRALKGGRRWVSSCADYKVFTLESTRSQCRATRQTVPMGNRATE